MRRARIIFVLMEKVIAKYASIEYVLKKLDAGAVRTYIAASVGKITLISFGDGLQQQQQQQQRHNYLINFLAMFYPFIDNYNATRNIKPKKDHKID